MSQQIPYHNRLLAALPAAVMQQLMPNLELVALQQDEVLHFAGSSIRFAYFPITAVVSNLYVTLNGASAAFAIVGNEGMVGLSIFMGGGTTPNHAVVQCAGHAYRLQAGILASHFADDRAMQYVLLHYAQMLLTQIAQTAICNRHHSIDQQLCRWLLLTADRLESSELNMTHTLISNMLGVRREGISEAAGRLQHAGLIHYKSGHISILDRAGMEARVCECYAIVKSECDRLLPTRTPLDSSIGSGVAASDLRPSPVFMHTPMHLTSPDAMP